ncbi:MAG: hypothetical protein Q8Q52_03290 [Acidimicrobiia bacterium]|nr:hypothetical protein [Acidimicrobiia bacterium]
MNATGFSSTFTAAATSSSSPSTSVAISEGRLLLVELPSTTLWSDGEAVWWATGCLLSIPPQCGKDVRILGISAEGLGALPGSETAKTPDARATRIWNSSLDVRGHYDPLTHTLELVEPIRAPGDPLAGASIPGLGRQPPPCESARGFSGSPPENPDIPNQLLVKLEARTGTFGGLWIAAGSVVVVQATDTTGYAELIESLYNGPYCLETVANSAADLDRVAERIWADRAALLAEGILLVSASTGIDSTLQVKVFVADPITVKVLTGRFGDTIRVTGAADYLAGPYDPEVCSSAEPGSIRDLSLDHPLEHRFSIRWADERGCPVTFRALAESIGSDHCGWQGATFLILGPSITGGGETWYARDPTGVLGRPDLVEGFVAGPLVPIAAEDTGFQSGNRHLWMLPDDSSYVYIVDGDRNEQWPRYDDPLLCM